MYYLKLIKLNALYTQYKKQYIQRYLIVIFKLFTSKEFLKRLISIIFIFPIVTTIVIIGGYTYKFFCYLVALGAIVEVFTILKQAILTQKVKIKTSVLWFFYWFIYITCAFQAIIAIRNDVNNGLSTITFLITIIVISDITAYLFGSIIKGPKIAPNISPNKTISGCVCGLLCSTIFAFMMQNFLFNLDNEKYNNIITNNVIDKVMNLGIESEIYSNLAQLTSTQFLLLSVGISLFSQLGDLIESFFKRICAVKDSSKLIPGHGGVLDRLDSIAAGTLFYYVVIRLVI